MNEVTMAISFIILCTLFSNSFAGRVLDLGNIGVPVDFYFPDKNELQFKGSVLEKMKELRYMKSWDSAKVSGPFIRRIKIDSERKKELSYKSETFCLSDTLYLIRSLTNPGTSENHNRTASAAMKYIDATTKIPSSILLGHWMWTGDYNECLDIEEVHNLNTSKSFRGKYFAVSLWNSEGKPLLGTYPVVVGICLPDSCIDDDASFLLKLAIGVIEGQVPLLQNISIEVGNAYTISDNRFSTGAKTFLVITGILVLLVVLGTVVDYFFAKEAPSEPKHFVANFNERYGHDDDRTVLLSNEVLTNNGEDVPMKYQLVGSKTLEFCRAFSIYSNGKKLFGTKTTEGSLACLNGMRVMSMWWVIIGHSYAFSVISLEDVLDAFQLIERFTFQPIANATYSVDSFFFLSGLLVAYLAFKQLKEKGSLNWFYYVVHRYWRLTPLYAFVIFYFTYVLPETVKGPISLAQKANSGKSFSESINICKQYWWTNLLYINNMYPNYGDMAKTCVGWGWYLANDMQFYLVLGPLVIVSLCLNKYVGVVVTAILTLACIITRISLVAYFGIYVGLQETVTKHGDNKWAKSGPLYQRPYARWSVYLIGMMTGYVLAQTNNRIKVHRVLALIAWCVSIASALAVVYGMYYYNHHITEQLHMSLTESVFYSGLGRTVWGLCLAWVVVGCISGNGSLVTDILSWKFWAPLGRLTYAAYLVHPVVMYTYNLNLPKPMHFSDLSMIYLFVANLVISYAIAFLVSMLVEAPMIQLEKLLLVPFGKFLQRHMTPVFKRLGMTLLGICRRSDDAE